VATANEMNIPPEWPASAPAIGYEWIEACRAKRIDSVLSKDTDHTIENSQSLQTDVYSRPAARICALLKGLESENPDARHGVELLSSWTFDLSAESAPGALYDL
jgi:penicillin G amidase